VRQGGDTHTLTPTIESRTLRRFVEGIADTVWQTRLVLRLGQIGRKRQDKSPNGTECECTCSSISTDLTVLFWAFALDHQSTHAHARTHKKYHACRGAFLGRRTGPPERTRTRTKKYHARRGTFLGVRAEPSEHAHAHARAQKSTTLGVVLFWAFVLDHMQTYAATRKSRNV
jgi:hypothetical protein